MIKVALIFIILLPITVQAAMDALPNGWRLPTQAEIDAVPMRSWSETKFPRVDGDFNADGKRDFAQLVKNEKIDGEGFAVHISTPSGYEWQIVRHFEYKNPSSKPTLRMGISIAEPGDYKTACGKGYWECDEGEPTILNLINIGIAYFMFESASSIWYWDNVKGESTQVWISD
jgi:hypothetical protein